MGGLAIYIASLACCAILFWAPNMYRNFIVSERYTLALLLLPCTVVLLLGVVDDLSGTVPWQKLLIQVIAAGLVWWAGFRIEGFPVLGMKFHSQVLSFLLTEFWIVAVTNSFNLIDGLDGLAAGIALFVTVSVFIVSFLQASTPLVCILTIILAGSLLGFLRFNFVPATIFLGDTGSLFLGFVLATLAMYTSQKSTTLLAIVVPYVAFGVPLLDMSMAVVRRFLTRRPVFKADHEHIHHRMLAKTHSTVMTVLSIYAMASVFTLGSIVIIRATGNLLTLVALIIVLSAWFLGRHVEYEELAEVNVYVGRGLLAQRQILANQILIRKAAKRLRNELNPEEIWQTLTATLEALGFDGVECNLSNWPGGGILQLPSWRRASESTDGDNWTLSVPLQGGETSLGEMRLYRALGRDRMLFQVSSVIDDLIPAFTEQLQRFRHGHLNAGENAAVAGSESSAPSPALDPVKEQ
jgi:UDP-GlcNAc:undecaprenyl-phosphate GlcNAc-1-phosphate transferase